ncbi:MAG: N-succinylarginine dihydrolase [Desulfomonilaceae bacterium]
MATKAFEVNFDGLVGPTHNYAGLSYGNVASIKHGLTVSNPKAAVIQGLEKMKLLMDLGLIQGVLPPQERPDIKMLRRLGFEGSDDQILSAAALKAPFLLAACYSASSMWAANAATVSPSTDTAEGKVHFTPANLLSQFHRSLESEFTGFLLKRIFSDERAFVHHHPLPSAANFSDEGAANHVRLCSHHGERGIELFVYGRKSFDSSGGLPEVFPARQTLEASSAIERLHRLDGSRTVFALQNPSAIDAGVFHNDVISVGNENVFFYHAQAFAGAGAVMQELRNKFRDCCNTELTAIEVSPDQVSLQDAVESFLFNSQLVTLPDETVCLIAPLECSENEKTQSLLMQIIADTGNPIQHLHYIDIRQSMRNGGGPACLRLRVVLTERERALTRQGAYLTDTLYNDLRAWANRYYRDRLEPRDLTDPALAEENKTALDALTQLLDLGSLYSFQME